MRSCTSCPSFLADTQSQEKFLSREVNAPICAVYGHVFSTPENDNVEANATVFAESCAYYGNPAPVKPVAGYSLPVWVPNPTRRKGNSPDERAVSCHNCAHSIPSPNVPQDLGLAACSARGILVHNAAALPKECDHNLHRVAATADEITNNELGELRPHLKDGFKVSDDKLVAALVSVTAEQVHPRDYPTDREVSEPDAEQGIRAWRKIPDPLGQYPDAWLPIYRGDYFTEAEKALIPQEGTDHHTEHFQDYFDGLRTFAVECYELDETLVLIGHPGVGKTAFCEWLAFLMQVPFHRISCTGDMEIDALIGKDQYHPERGTYFEDGVLVKAYERPSLTVVDENNLAPRELREFLRPMTDNAKQFALGTRLIVRDPGSFLVLTENPSWDSRNVGTEDRALADANRLSPFWIDLPPETIEKAIIRQRCAADGFEISEEQLKMVMDIAKDLRGLCADDQLSDFWGMRQQIKVARKLRWWAPAKAYRRAALDFYDPEVANVAMTAIKSHIKK